MEAVPWMRANGGRAQRAIARRCAGPVLPLDVPELDGFGPPGKATGWRGVSVRAPRERPTGSMRAGSGMVSWALVAFVPLSACGPALQVEADHGPREERPAAPVATLDVERTPARDAARDEWVENSFLPGGATIDSVVAAFGEPDSLIATPIQNVHEPAQTDTLYKVVYTEGLEAWIYRVTGGGEFISVANVRSNRFLRPGEVGIGTPWNEVLDRFGPPLGELGGVPWFVSQRTIGADEPVYFEVRNGAVHLIRFEFYIG